jgi:hypothetical protein
MFPKLVRTSAKHYSAQIVVESKGYITVDMGRNPRATNLYWQIVDPQFSLLELGFEYPSGRLVKCAVPLFNGEIESRISESLPHASPGTPFFDLSPWSVDVNNPAARGNHLEQRGRIRLLRKHQGLSIVWSDSPVRRLLAYGTNLICSFSEEEDLVELSLVGDFQI